MGKIELCTRFNFMVQSLCHHHFSVNSDFRNLMTNTAEKTFYLYSLWEPWLFLKSSKFQIEIAWNAITVNLFLCLQLVPAKVSMPFKCCSISFLLYCELISQRTSCFSRKQELQKCLMIRKTSISWETVIVQTSLFPTYNFIFYKTCYCRWRRPMALWRLWKPSNISVIV